MGLLILSLSMTSNLNNAWFISIFGFIAAVAISIYSIVGSGIAISENNEEDDINFAIPSHVGDSKIGLYMGVMSAVGSIVFAYGYHSVMPDIQASLHEHNTADAHRDMKKATTFAYMFAFPAYMMSAIRKYKRI
jgi:amino acid permease